jgi:hypothetical protein
MGYFNRSVADEYDDKGNYIGNSPDGNAFHGVAPAGDAPVPVCAACGSARRAEHIHGGTVCGECGCGEVQVRYR